MIWKVTIGHNITVYWANAETIQEAIIKAETMAMKSFNDPESGEEIIDFKATKAELFLSENLL